MDDTGPASPGIRLGPPVREGSGGPKPSMRQLWSDQVVFTRQYVIAAVAGRPVSEVLTKLLGQAVAPIATAPGVRELVPQLSDGDAAAVGLLTTMEATGEALEPYFGEESAHELTSLLRRHVLIAVELLSAARSGQIEKFKKEDERWIASANEIAEFLNSLNQAWPREVLEQHLQLLLQLTKDEAVARIAGNSRADLRTYDAIHGEAMVIADLLEEGLAKKLPPAQAAGVGKDRDE
jgi:hypothetical protein